MAETSALFTDESIEDALLVITYSGLCPEEVFIVSGRLFDAACATQHVQGQISLRLRYSLLKIWTSTASAKVGEFPMPMRSSCIQMPSCGRAKTGSFPSIFGNTGYTGFT